MPIMQWNLIDGNRSIKWAFKVRHPPPREGMANKNKTECHIHLFFCQIFVINISFPQQYSPVKVLSIKQAALIKEIWLRSLNSLSNSESPYPKTKYCYIKDRWYWLPAYEWTQGYFPGNIRDNAWDWHVNCGQLYSKGALTTAINCIVTYAFMPFPSLSLS